MNYEKIYNQIIDRAKIRVLEGYKETFSTGFYDSTQFDVVDTVGNVYNRLVIWDALTIHAATKYFGTDLHNSRLFHLFFFDVEK
jgi:hypothetical protein